MHEELEPEERPRTWGGRRPGAGRPPGRIDQRPRELREAMIDGANNSDYGKDPEHPDQPGDLERFFTTLANNNIGIYCMLFGKLIHRHIYTQSEVRAEVTYQSVDDVKRALEEAGMPIKQIEVLILRACDPYA